MERSNNRFALEAGGYFGLSQGRKTHQRAS
jgi:hypothetical protein